MTLTEALRDEQLVRRIVADGARIIDEEVSRKRGVSGMALKAGYKAFKKIQPGITERSLAHLLPEFAPVIDPHYARAVEQGDVDGYFRVNADKVADDLLGVTDRRAEGARHRVMLKIYRSLRPYAKRYTAESVPRIPELVARHVPAG